MYKILTTKRFDDIYKKRVKGNSELEKKVIKTIQQLRNDPFFSSLKTHRVATRKLGRKWSSFVTGDLRIIWDLNSNIIEIYDLGSHSGKNKVYK